MQSGGAGGGPGGQHCHFDSHVTTPEKSPYSFGLTLLHFSLHFKLVFGLRGGGGVGGDELMTR